MEGIIDPISQLRFSPRKEIQTATASEISPFALSWGISVAWVALLFLTLRGVAYPRIGWITYLSGLFILPFILRGGSALWTSREPSAFVVRRVLCSIPVLLALYLGSGAAFFAATLFVLIQIGVETIFCASFRRWTWAAGREWVFLWSFWVLVGKLCYWETGGFGSFFLSRARVSLATVTLLVALCTALYGQQWRLSVWGKRALFFCLAIAISPLLFRISGWNLDAFGTHWGFFCGSAELVRQGGWLLHNVPSQYGFLNTLLIALGPFDNPFSNLTVFQGGGYFGLALILLWLFTQLFEGIVGGLLSVFLVFVFLFHVPGVVEQALSPLTLPSVGPFRFFGAYLFPLLVFKLCLHCAEEETAKRWLRLGNLLWLFSMFWSFEAAAYGSVAWLPAYGLMLYFRGERVKGLVTKGLLLLSSWVVLVLGISIFYRYRLGVWPDFYAFIEYPLAYTGGFGALVARGDGALWILVALASFHLYSMISFMRDGFWAGLPVAVSTFATFWIVSSYFVSRSHDNNIINLFPIYLSGIILNLLVLRSHAPSEFQHLLRFLVPLVVIPASLYLGNENAMADYLSDWKNLSEQARHLSHLEDYPTPPPEALALLKKSGVDRNDAIAYFGTYLFVWPEDSRSPGTGPQLARFFLPVAPSAQWNILPDGRQTRYFELWFTPERRQRGGYILSPSRPHSGFVARMQEKFRLEYTRCEDGWCLQHYLPAAG